MRENLDYEKSKLVQEGQTIKRIFYDDEGNVIHVASFRIHEETDCPISASEDPQAYHRWYYRNVRRHRDRRKPRLPDL